MKKITSIIAAILILAPLVILISGCSNTEIQIPDGDSGSLGTSTTSSSTPTVERVKNEAPQTAEETSSQPEIPPEPTFAEFDENYADYLSHRFSEAQVEFIRSCVFMGDSTCLSFANYGLISSTRCFAKVGLAARNISNFTFYCEGEEYTPIEALRKTGCENFYFLMGINDVNMTSVSEYIENYGAFLNEVESALPNANIYILSVTPVTAGSSFCSNAALDRMNSALEQMALQSGSRTFIDISSVLKNGSALSGAYAAEDGIHMRANAYYKILDVICEKAGVL